MPERAHRRSARVLLSSRHSKVTPETESNTGVPARQKPCRSDGHRTGHPPLPGNLFLSPERQHFDFDAPGASRLSPIPWTAHASLPAAADMVVSSLPGCDGPILTPKRIAIYISAVGPNRAVLTCCHPCTRCARRVSYPVQLVSSRRERGDRWKK